MKNMYIVKWSSLHEWTGYKGKEGSCPLHMSDTAPPNTPAANVDKYNYLLSPLSR